MVWESERLLLRYTTHEDLNDLFRIYGNPETHKFNPLGPHSDIEYSKGVLERTLNIYEEHGFGDWTIFEKSNPDKVIGFGGVFISQFDGRKTNNLGYRFEPDAWGKGYATELSRRAIRFGFEEVGLDEIIGVVRANHIASRRVLEKSGLKFLKKIVDSEDLPPNLMFQINRTQWMSDQS
ncbi:GNAT family N-acetyltransferase [Pantoea sp. At-9b]|uniref:GNAT family N-acetyltransferase n=1 Tax=Pantoea sp. (strain At-9b) TaxID=592316 RepID=UPI0001B3E17C|nr:GNAT family N-acetyltransferase [Pantoea sp. At-9b]ADU72599.1 GCN5-related N-acetyltransferase [Pantoea sp. At-9b]